MIQFVSGYVVIWFEYGTYQFAFSKDWASQKKRDEI